MNTRKIEYKTKNNLRYFYDQVCRVRDVCVTYAILTQSSLIKSSTSIWSSLDCVVIPVIIRPFLFDF